MMEKYREEKRKPKKVVNKNNADKEKSKSKSKQKTSKGFYYSFLTIILFLCLIQITVSAILNVSKKESFKSTFPKYSFLTASIL